MSLGFEKYVSKCIGNETYHAIQEFKSKNKLVIDGIVGPKTRVILLQVQQKLTQFNDTLLYEDDLKEFSTQSNLELAPEKAVNKVKSNGKGFFLDGHIFWPELKARGVNSKTTHIKAGLLVFMRVINKNVSAKKK